MKDLQKFDFNLLFSELVIFNEIFLSLLLFLFELNFELFPLLFKGFILLKILSLLLLSLFDKSFLLLLILISKFSLIVFVSVFPPFYN